MDFISIVEYAKNGSTMPKISSQSEQLAYTTITGILGNWKLGLVTNRRALEEKERAERLFEDAKREENQRFKIYQIYNQNMIRAGELICAARKENHSPNADKDKVIALLMEAVERMGGLKGGDLDGEIPKEKCVGCMVNWLGKEE